MTSAEETPKKNVPLRIGRLTLETPFLSAPMAGFSNGAFRAMLRSLGGAGLIATEMISARAFVHLDAAREGCPDRLWGIENEPGPLAIQIWDNQPETLAETAEKIAAAYRPAVIDLNFGCPAPKIAKNSASGSALLRDPVRVGDLVAMAARVCKTFDIPVTAKIRLGLTADTINASDVAQAVEGAGGAALTLHGRTAQQMYRGEADWEKIAAVKPFLKRIPLIGNGDIQTAQEALSKLHDYNVDGVMIGRAALRKPWIFREAAALYFGTCPPNEPNAEQTRELILTHFALVRQRFGDEKGTLLMRKYAAEWSHGRIGAKRFRIEAAAAATPNEFLESLERFFNAAPHTNDNANDNINNIL